MVNYLDDYFFVDMLKSLCNAQVQQFLDICNLICFPVSLEKTFWATTSLVFFGLLIDTIRQYVCVPIEKLDRAVKLISDILDKTSGKVTVKQLQKICRFLNFLGRCIVPGRAFTRRLYAKLGSSMKPHHHIRINGEMQLDLEMALFLETPLCLLSSIYGFQQVMGSTGNRVFHGR